MALFNVPLEVGQHKIRNWLTALHNQPEAFVFTVSKVCTTWLIMQMAPTTISGESNVRVGIPSLNPYGWKLRMSALRDFEIWLFFFYQWWASYTNRSCIPSVVTEL
ncbi:uncharacterized protein PGTG_12899 [Puccinia graminis f. sp. tritici CRL 75-36-700-3]|uniref:Uncharacterized protein n=1 Tax=Puccinia graminis f. sp. tritici (strain CRL 75-36-700-3 / race SCCL) TaxID=418459 RepID=E3KSM9_PUCGT|nr:uncharacterized protein PGTG_12899 [Puccinia graminis f. sp. tritici CRL 75-36-700-3]EFP87315.1 hypothetical protein PGTG_12899 [Puccinia graminis f. sp. tritici CRL 75-36-700-3]